MHPNFTKLIFDLASTATPSSEPITFEVRNPILDQMGVKDLVQFGSGDLIAACCDPVLAQVGATPGLEDVQEGLDQLRGKLRDIIHQLFSEGESRHWPAFVWTSPLHFSVPSMVNRFSGGQSLLPREPDVGRPRRSPFHSALVYLDFDAEDQGIQLDTSGIRFAYPDETARERASLAMMKVSVGYQAGRTGYQEIYSERLGKAQPSSFDRQCLARGEFPDHVYRAKGNTYTPVRLVSFARLRPRYAGLSGWWQEIQVRLVPEDGSVSIITAGQSRFEFLYGLLYDDLASVLPAGFKSHTYPRLF